jgi:hypothetical protein
MHGLLGRLVPDNPDASLHVVPDLEHGLDLAIPGDIVLLAQPGTHKVGDMVPIAQPGTHKVGTWFLFLNLKLTW